ncbi:PREDICTED: protein PF14_0175 isoform X2 [Ceratosolen solmsi marchali]|uniref:Protein PF14_0175 isoform X2 n=1 Tax=Ceratosolen solmsi marchali TaxID=326594 RepID=A0AAJ7E0K8_9HYME|nr:PREDICTED: protein PF14_0175 isoform X2 [Ceratosolen solmsi marchali]
MSSAPVRGIVPQRQRRHHRHHIKHQRRYNTTHNKNETKTQSIKNNLGNNECTKKEEIYGKRPKVNPIFLWAAQREQRIVEVRCEDYDKRNRIKLTKTAQGWRSIPRTVLTAYPVMESVIENEIEQNSVTITSKNEEKENSSRDQVEIKQIRVGEDTRINNDSKVNKNKEERERYKQKRKNYTELSKNKKEKINSEAEEFSINETLVSTNWKMKKRRKLDKNKKRKKLYTEEIVMRKNKIYNQNKIKFKEESTNKNEEIDEIRNTKEFNIKEDKKFQKYISNSEKVMTLVDNHKMYNDLEKLENNRHFQPRVVLEQLHLSQLPIRIHRRLMTKIESEKNYKKSEGNSENNVDEIVLDNVENNNQNNNESQIDSENEVILNEEDWLDMLNILNSDDIPINVNKKKSCLIDNRNLTKSSKTLDTAILLTNQINDSNINLLSKECEKNQHELTAIEKKIKFERNNIKHRIGSKSLNETIQRLEKSINNHKKIKSVSDILITSEYGLNKQKLNKIKYTPYDDASHQQSRIGFCNSTSISLIDKIQEINAENDILESSKILRILKNTPGLSVSLAVSGRKHTNFINTISSGTKFLPSNRTPDSKTNVTEEIKSLPGISIVIPTYSSKSKQKSSILKNRVDLPKSTLNFSNNEMCHCDINNCEDEENQEYDSVIDKIENQNNYKRHSIKCTYRSKDFQHFYDDQGKNFLVDSTKVPNLKPLIQLFYKNSESQTNYSDLYQYKEIDNLDEQIIDDFNSQILPQPSRIPYLMTSPRQSSAYLERLLPSPPCSVSCSEDAKNDLSFKDILSSPNIDSRNQVEEDQVTDLNNYCAFELNPSYSISDDTYLQKSSITDKVVINKKSQRLITTDIVNRLEMKNHTNSIINDDVQNSFTKDCISSKYPLSADWTINQNKIDSNNGCLPNNSRYTNQDEFISRMKLHEMYVSPNIFLDPASQLRELMNTSGHLIPDPLLVPRDYLPLLAGAPLIEIPKLLITRPELRLPEALTRPELLRDPDLLVISLTHLQHVLDYGERSIGKDHQSNQRLINTINQIASVQKVSESKCEQQRPKLICKPIGKLMPRPVDLSNNQNLNSYPSLLRIRSGLLKQESEVSSTANSPDESRLWHPLFGKSVYL